MAIKNIHIITRLDMGGSAQNTLASCHGLASGGLKGKYEEVLVFGASEESEMTQEEKQAVARGVDAARAAGVRLIETPVLVRRISPINDLRALFFLLALFLREKPEIVHTHTSKAGILGRVAAFLAVVPVIVHTPHGLIFFGHFGKLKSNIFLWIERFAALITHRQIALTKGELADTVRYRAVKKDGMSIVHSGVDIEVFQKSRKNRAAKRQELGFEPDDSIVGFTGWLLPIKGPMYLLNAMGQVWERFPDTKLVFVGKGDLHKSLVARAAEMGAADRVFFLGWRDDVKEIMPVFDIFVLPSMNEGMGRVIVEAMAAGVPVVATRTGGIPDLVEHGETGLLATPADSKELGEAIFEICVNKELTKKMVEKSSITCQHYSVNAMISKIDSIYDSLLN